MKKLNSVSKLLLIGSGYLSMVGFGVIEESIDKYNMDKLNYIETINTLEDMKEWMNSDINNSIIDQTIGETYIENIDACLSRLEDLDRVFDCENCDEID